MFGMMTTSASRNFSLTISQKILRAILLKDQIFPTGPRFFSIHFHVTIRVPYLLILRTIFPHYLVWGGAK